MGTIPITVSSSVGAPEVLKLLGEISYTQNNYFETGEILLLLAYTAKWFQSKNCCIYSSGKSKVSDCSKFKGSMCKCEKTMIDNENNNMAAEPDMKLEL